MSIMPGPEPDSLFAVVNTAPIVEIKGETFDPAEDGERLSQQYERVVEAVKDGEWWTLAALAKAVGSPEASVSARLRDMRRDAWIVERRRVPGGNGLHEYRALSPDRVAIQRSWVIAAMLDGDRLNAAEAHRRWGYMNLVGRVEELREDGCRILSDIGPDKCAVYWMPQDEIARIRGANP
jgi:hypothetical protein